MHTDNFNENYESYKAVSLTVALDFSFFFFGLTHTKLSYFF